MHGLDSLAHERPDYRAQGEDIGGAQLIDAFVGALGFDDCVEIAAVGYVYDQGAKAWDVDFDALGRHVGRYVADGDTRDLVSLGRVIDADQAGGYFQAQAPGCARADEAVFERKGDDTDGAVTAHW